MKKIIILKLILQALTMSICLAQQDSLRLWLDDALEIGLEQSIKAQQLSRQYEVLDIKINRFNKRNLPRISFSSTVPNFSRSISTITQPDGRDEFVERFQANSSANININQAVPFTRGNLSIYTSLQRLDIFGSSRNTTYSSVPVSISYSQSLLDYNSFKEDRELFSLNMNSSKIQLLQKRIDLKTRIFEQFLRAYRSQQNQELLKSQIQIYESTLFKSEELFELGKLSEADILRIQVELEQAKLRFNQGLIERSTSYTELKTLLNLEEDFKLFYDNLMPSIELDKEFILERSLKYFEETAVLPAQLEEEIAAKRLMVAKRPSVSLSASVGSNSSSEQFRDIYNTVQQRQSLNLSIQFPLVTWGQLQDDVKLAEFQRKQRFEDLDEQRIRFLLQINNSIDNLNSMYRSAEILSKMTELNSRELEKVYSFFLIGRKSLFDLQQTLQKKEKIQLDKIDLHLKFWKTYLSIEKLAFYDFINDVNLDSNIF